MNNTILITLGIIGYLLFVMFPLNKGAPIIPSNSKKLTFLLDILKQKYGLDYFKKAVDLGSGDGRVVIFLTKNDINCDGIELNKILYYISKRKLKKEKLETKSTIYNNDFFKFNLNNYNLVIVWQAPQIMKKLENKLKRELKPGTVVCSYYFAIPGFENETVHKGWHIYEIPSFRK